MNETNYKKSKNSSSFFLILFWVPTAIWIVISIIAKFSEDNSTDPLTWGDLIIMDSFLVSLWFTISSVIKFIFNKIRKPKSVVVPATQCLTKNDAIVIIKPEEKKESLKLKEQKETSSKKNKKKNKCIYECDSIIDAYECRKMVKYFPQVYWANIRALTFVNFIFSIMNLLMHKSIINAIIFFIVFQIFLMIFFKLTNEHFAEKSFNRINKEKRDTELHIEFYDAYLIRQGENVTHKIYYADISKCVESDTNFYFYHKITHLITIIQKNQCELELINFIREKIKVTNNCLGDNSKFEGVKKYNNSSFIKKAMALLFVLTIISLICSLNSWEFLNNITHNNMHSYDKNVWVIWCWLVIPILSIILGFKLKKAGFDCDKNIISGFIIAILMLIYGAFYLLIPSNEVEYSKIKEYENIIDASLPVDGKLEIMKWGISFDDDKTDYAIITAYYDHVDEKELVNSIENSDNWFLGKDIKSELNILIPSQISVNDYDYFSIYNLTTNQYNTTPDKTGYYDIYVMMYNKSDKILNIHKFKYLYKS